LEVIFLNKRIEKAIASVKPADKEAMTAAKERQAQLAKPPGSLGVLEELSIKVAGMTGKIHNKADNKINLIQQNNSKATLNYSLVANDKVKLGIDSTLSGDNNETEIKIASVTENNGSTIIKSTADVLPNIKENNLIESIKILVLNNEESICIPNLLVSSNEVEVNHAATISCVDPNYLFYLNSKGISNEAATRLIKNGYLLNNLNINKEIKEEIMELIGGE
jgi:Fe-S cluster assembly scaffold protein SufB